MQSILFMTAISASILMASASGMFNASPFEGASFRDAPLDARAEAIGFSFASFVEAATAALADWERLSPATLTDAFDQAEDDGGDRQIALTMASEIDLGAGVTRTVMDYASPFARFEPTWRITVLDDGAGRLSLGIVEADGLPGWVRAEAVAHGAALARGMGSVFIGVVDDDGRLTGSIAGGLIDLDDIPDFVAGGIPVAVICWNSVHVTCQ